MGYGRTGTRGNMPLISGKVALIGVRRVGTVGALVHKQI